MIELVYSLSSHQRPIIEVDMIELVYTLSSHQRSIIEVDMIELVYTLSSHQRPIIEVDMIELVYTLSSHQRPIIEVDMIVLQVESCCIRLWASSANKTTPGQARSLNSATASDCTSITIQSKVALKYYLSI